MFVDIRSFTTAARTRTPAEVVERLDDVSEILVDIVDRHNGIVNKFLGDGLLAIFGAPIDDPLEAANAVAAAREMLMSVEGAMSAIPGRSASASASTSGGRSPERSARNAARNIRSSATR